MKKIIIGTRGSKLALWQANWVRDLILKAQPGVTVDLARIKTRGDKILDVPLAKVGGKGLFVKEIEEALLDGRCDIAVHSLKDVPTEFPDGLCLSTYLKREDPRDVLITRNNIPLSALPDEAIIGTSSLRRRSQILGHRPGLNLVDLRGNLDTRIRKLQTEGLDGIIVAASGVKRLELGNHISETFPVDFMLPAIGQGIVTIESRGHDPEVLDIIRPMDHEETRIAALVERAFLKRLEGGCQVPIAAYASILEGKIYFNGLLGSLDGKTMLKESSSCALNDPEFVQMGDSLATNILRRGGDKILAEVYGQ